MQQRYYDPLAGRFLSVDPVVTDANSGSSFGRYHYANNSPYRYVDPTGMAPNEEARKDAGDRASERFRERCLQAAGNCQHVDFTASASEAAHGALFLGSFAPLFFGSAASGLDAGLYAFEGDWDEAKSVGLAAAGGLFVDAGLLRLGAKAAQAGANANRLHHIFGKAEHALGDFVKAQGGEEQAFRAIQNAANQAVREGKLTVGPNGILPRGNAGNIIDVAGTQIRLIGGRVVNGVVEVSSASRLGLP